MQYRVLACDYDRTIALNGIVSRPARRLLHGVRDTGRQLVLVTGRTRQELDEVFDEQDLFSLLVVENGAIVVDPATGGERLLGPLFPPRLAEALEVREVAPLVVGRVMCSTAAPNRPALQAAMAETAIQMKLVLNRDSVMALPPHVDKGLGLRAAMANLGQPLQSVVAVGDGENDVPLLQAAGVGVAVENSVQELMDRADIVLREIGVAGLERLCSSLVEQDLADLLEQEAPEPVPHLRA